MSFIQFSKLSKTFESKVQALSEINLSVNEGELLVIVGPSGCGKSTLLRTLAGLETPSSGSISIAGKKINDLEPHDRNIGMVFQNFALFPHLSAFENMALGLKAKKIPHTQIVETINTVAERLQIKDLLNRKPNQLSGGQRQRIALARLLARNPKIQLFDEPLSNLDAHLRNLMRSELKKLHLEDQRTTLFVTHDQMEAMTLGQRIAVMNAGRIEQIGTPNEIYQKPENQFVASFFGSPSINLLKGELRNSVEGQTMFSLGNMELKVPKSISPPKLMEVTLGIRAEDFSFPTENEENLDLHFRGKIIYTDELGDSKIIHCKIGEEVICVRTSSEFNSSQQEMISLVPNWEKVHWFNTSTEERIN